MECAGDDTVMALVSGELPPSRRDELRAHLDDCDACRELVAHTAHALIPTVDERPNRDPALEATAPSPGQPQGLALGPGATLGRYRIVRKLGAGAMGVVYAAEHLDLRRSVALKIVRADPDGDEEQLRARLLREARAASAVRHPHVVTVHDVLELDDGSPVMVMDLLEGESLRDRLKRGPLPIDDVTTLAEQLLSALGAAHGAGIIHRDLKPDNVFLVRSDDGRVDVRVLDFGIAKLTAVDGPAMQTAGLTMTGMLVGTPHYMAPEQAFADPDLDARVDLWAVGVIVYEALSGRRPVEGDNLGQLFRKLATLNVAPLVELAPNVPSPLADWVHRLLAERERRFGSAATARRALTTTIRSGLRLDDSVAPMALGDSANGFATPPEAPKRRPPIAALSMAAVIAAVVGLSSLSTEEPVVVASALAPSWGPIPMPSVEPPPQGDVEPIDSTPTSAAPKATVRSTVAPRPVAPTPLTHPKAAPPVTAEPESKPSQDGPGKLLTKPPF
ncbi:MAG TPA: serine/threonine protein kinase [Polyangiaceae bacterium]|nr:serine/threonine protein kinase [Polyangiaceae bacterium]